MKRQWIVEGLIPFQHIVLIVGQPGNGKSWWVGQLAVDLASGTSHLGEFDTLKSYVIHIDEDTPQDVYETRITRLATAKNLNGTELELESRSMSGFRLSSQLHREALISQVKDLVIQGKHPVVIMDSLTKIMSGQNLDTSDKASKVMTYLTELRDTGTTILLVHHITTKKDVDLSTWAPNQVMGFVMNNTMIVASCDTSFIVCKLPVNNSSLFNIIPNPRRLSLRVDRPFCVELREDKGRNTWANLILLEEVPKVPSSAAKKVFKLFGDTTKNPIYTADKIKSLLAGRLMLPVIEQALEELCDEHCLKETIDPNAKSNACTYKKDTSFYLLTNFYKDNLV